MKRSKPASAAPKSAGSGEVHRLMDILPGLSRELRLEEKTREFSLLNLCDRLLLAQLGPAIQSHAKASHLHRQGGQCQLVLAVDNGAVATELSFHVEALCRELNTYSPQTGITLASLVVRIRK